MFQTTNQRVQLEPHCVNVSSAQHGELDQLAAWKSTFEPLIIHEQHQQLAGHLYMAGRSLPRLFRCFGQ